MTIHDPIVLAPPDCDVDAIWAYCHEASERIANPDGTLNMGAAMCADPGIVSCPVCERDHWNIGARQRCTACSFEYPTDWWPMFSWGTSARINPKYMSVVRRLHDERIRHPYYRWAFDHGDQTGPPTLEKAHAVDWRTIMEGKP